MRIDRKLNLVFPFKTENAGTVHFHSVSIGRETFELYYLEIGKVFTQCFDKTSEAHLMLSAPQLAYPALKSISNQMGTWEGSSGVQFGLINEIIRLTNISVSTEEGWKHVPMNSAMQNGVLTEDEQLEVLSSIIFFTSVSRVSPKNMRGDLMEMIRVLHGWEVTTLDFMAYQNSLPTLTEAVPSTKKESSLIS